MRTNIVIDDRLMAEAMAATGLNSKKDTVEAGLRMLVKVRRQAALRELRGAVQWRGDLDAMRTDG